MGTFLEKCRKICDRKASVRRASHARAEEESGDVRGRYADLRKPDRGLKPARYRVSFGCSGVLGGARGSAREASEGASKGSPESDCGRRGRGFRKRAAGTAYETAPALLLAAPR